jgi:Uma2 family endonuclease
MKQTMTRKGPPAAQANGSIQIHRFSVDEYHEMIDKGFLAEDVPVELLDGWIVDKMPQDPPHSTAVRRLDRWLSRLLDENDWTLCVQCPVTLATSEPEPDIAIARGPDSLYLNRHPGPSDILQAIEVAKSSLTVDREEKMPIYAAARIPHYWIVNLVDGCVECYSRPQAGRNPAYRSTKVLTRRNVLTLVLDGKKYGTLSIDQLMS